MRAASLHQNNYFNVKISKYCLYFTYFLNFFLLTPPFIIKTIQSSIFVESQATHTYVKLGTLRRGYCHSFLFEVHSSEGRSWLAEALPQPRTDRVTGCFQLLFTFSPLLLIYSTGKLQASRELEGKGL